MFNLAADHQSHKTLFLSHMLSKYIFPYFIRKLTTRRMCLSNSRLFTQTSKKLCYQTQEGFTKAAQM
jgi:hypothetical protein